MTQAWCKRCNAEMEPAEWKGTGLTVYQCPTCPDFVSGDIPEFVRASKPSFWQVVRWTAGDLLRKVAS